MIRMAAGALLALALSTPMAGAEFARSSQTQDRTAGVGLSAILTRTLTRQLRRDLGYCQTVVLDYSFDCVKYAFRSASEIVDGNPAYRTAQAGFDQTARQIKGMVQAETDRSRLPKLRGFQIYYPVNPEAAPAVEREMTAAISALETQLRSAPEQVGSDYQQIADAVRQTAP
ncbi:MAG: hypothetical protein AAGF79_02590 [Pseudomonadota bacterium]